MKSLVRFIFVFVLCPPFILPVFCGEEPEIGDAPPPLRIGTAISGPPANQLAWQNFQGNVVVLEFWNTACAPCVAAIPHLNQLVAEFTNKPVVFLSICDDNPDYLRKFLRAKPMAGWLAVDAPLRPTFSAFVVAGIPHTVIVDRSGKIAAITHPDLLKPQHIQEILDDKPSSLPAPDSVSSEESPISELAELPPLTVEVSITGPFPKPHGAFASRGWSSETIFHADKAPVADILTEFFQISDQLMPKIKYPEGLYSAYAAAPAGQRAVVQKGFIQAARDRWSMSIVPATQLAKVYIVTVEKTNAPGLQPVQKRGGGGQKDGGFYLRGSHIKTIVKYLEWALDKPVVDETGLEGLWAAELNCELAAEELAAEAQPAPAKVIKAAREQMGLHIAESNREMPTLRIETFAK